MPPSLSASAGGSAGERDGFGEGQRDLHHIVEELGAGGGHRHSRRGRRQRVAGKRDGVAGRTTVAGDIGVARGIDLHRTHFGIGRIRRKGRGIDILVGAVDPDMDQVAERPAAHRGVGEGEACNRLGEGEGHGRGLARQQRGLIGSDRYCRRQRVAGESKRVAGRTIVTGEIAIAGSIDLDRARFGIGRARREGRGVNILMGAVDPDMDQIAQRAAADRGVGEREARNRLGEGEGHVRGLPGQQRGMIRRDRNRRRQRIDLDAEIAGDWPQRVAGQIGDSAEVAGGTWRSGVLSPGCTV